VLQGKPQIKFGARFTESSDSLNIKILKKNHLETQTNAQNNKRQNLPIKIAAVWQIFLPPIKHVKIFSYIFIQVEDENVQFR
jgi:hypothetical protein